MPSITDITAAMFRRPFRSQDPNTRVDKTARLKKTPLGTPVGAIRDPRVRVRTASRAGTPTRDRSRDVRDRKPREREAKEAREAREIKEAKERAMREREARERELKETKEREIKIKDEAKGRTSRDRERTPARDPPLTPSAVVTLTVGKEGRVFAAHEDILCQAPFFESACHGKSPGQKRIHLPEEEPEVLSAVLEYLYKGDYYPRLLPGKQRDSWELEDAQGPAASPLPSLPPTPQMDGEPRKSSSSSATSRPEATVYMAELGHHVLRDTAIYCAADRFGIDELKRLSLRKQGLQAGIDVATILRSAQFAYANTPDSDSSLRAHYLALIIRCRRTFKRSSTLQAEMEKGGSRLYFDLFVAMCNHLDDVIDAGARSPRQ